MTLLRLDDAGLKGVARMMGEFYISSAPFGRLEGDLSIETYQHHGKYYSPDRLNLCDCGAYALGWTLAAHLLFNGADFGTTDIISADLVP